MEREPVRDSGLRGTPPKKKTAKKGKKKWGRKGSRSEANDSDTGSLSRMSESSRVSFDPAPSDAEETPAGIFVVYIIWIQYTCITMELLVLSVLYPNFYYGTAGASRNVPVDGMSVQRLTLLGRVHVARVVVDNLQLEEEPSLDDSMSSVSSRGRPKLKSKGRPPRPSPKSKKNWCVLLLGFLY